MELARQGERVIGELRETLSQIPPDVDLLDIIGNVREPAVLSVIKEYVGRGFRVAYLGPEGTFSHEVAIHGGLLHYVG